ncbi:uncharacterized protein [Haliotis cracherodii]|uniref:uncharacterized protein n=1 Tax=Haliotis cracherodii TaxID=6455 RepID=UPI0039E79977
MSQSGVVKKRPTVAKLLLKDLTGQRKSLKTLKADPSITIAPADKGRATVIMDTSDFNAITSNILDDQTTYQKLKKDSTTRLQREHKTLLKELREKNEIGPTLHKKMTVPHPKPPYARATIKISTITEPGTLVSYDVVDLFTNVAKDEALSILRRRIEAVYPDLDTHLSIDSIFKLITSCITSTYLTWQDKIYQQTHGLPMGSSLSPLITEIYMTDLEETALHTSPITPLCWFRKVDDTFVILQPEHDPKTLLNHLNAQHPRMQFTMEEEVERQLPFIDLKTELNHLHHVFTNFNNYPTSLVEQTINSILSPRERPPRQHTALFVISVPYIGTASHQIRRLLKHHAYIDTVFQRGRTIQNILSANGKPPTWMK